MESCPGGMRECSCGGTPLCTGLSIFEAFEAVPLDCNYGLDNFGTAFFKSGGHILNDISVLRPPVTDELGDYQIVIAPQHLPTPPTPAPEIDEVDAADAPLRRLLALASVVGLPRQIERDQEENTVTRPQMPPLVTQGRMATFTVLASRADGTEPISGSGVEQHAPAE